MMDLSNPGGSVDNKVFSPIFWAVLEAWYAGRPPKGRAQDAGECARWQYGQGGDWAGRLVETISGTRILSADGRRVGLPQRHHGPVPAPPWGEAGPGIAPEISRGSV
jgi:hypothetical protein